MRIQLERGPLKVLANLKVAQLSPLILAPWGDAWRLLQMHHIDKAGQVAFQIVVQFLRVETEDDVGLEGFGDFEQDVVALITHPATCIDYAT